MSKKTFALVSGIVGGLQTIGVAIIEICTKFVKPE